MPWVLPRDGGSGARNSERDVDVLHRPGVVSVRDTQGFWMSNFIKGFT